MKRKNKVLTWLAILTHPVIELVLMVILVAQAQELNHLSEKVEQLETQPPTVKTVELLTVADPVAPEPEQPEQYTEPYTAEDVELIARTIWGEAGGVQSKAERAAVAWCILNRVDTYDKTIAEIVTAPYQFQGYRPEGDCPQEHYALARDVLERWVAEKNGAADVGRVLPTDCLYFMGDGERNHFTAEWKSTDYWGWELPDPYR